MQAITSHLATYLLLIHMVLGCCFHHAHACERECCPEPAAVSHSCVCHDSASPEMAVSKTAVSELVENVGDLPPDHHDRHHHQCEGDQCRFVGVARVLQHDHELNACIRSLSLALVSHGSDAIGKTIVQGADHSQLTSGFSLRAHLQLRVLLI